MTSNFQFLSAAPFSNQEYLESSLLPQNNYVVDGDLMIGIILPSGRLPSGALCGSETRPSSLDLIYSYK